MPEVERYFTLAPDLVVRPGQADGRLGSSAPSCMVEMILAAISPTLTLALRRIREHLKGLEAAKRRAHCSCRLTHTIFPSTVRWMPQVPPR